MFKAVNIVDQSEIVILDPCWENRLGVLRTLDERDALVCQACRQPVRVRAGNVRRWHFAHKHLQNCPYENESPVLLETRAVLYKWLVAKFGRQFVTLEKQFRHAQLPRSVDCWVDKEGRQIAYWIFDTRLPPDTREALQDAFHESKIQVNWVFVSEMLHEAEENEGNLHLSTTERQFIQPSVYDEPNGSKSGNSVGSLHYLDPAHEAVATFRALRLVHEPQLYAGCKKTSPLSSLLVLGSSGEFVYPGERESLEAFRNEKQGQIQARAKLAEDHGRTWPREHLFSSSRYGAGIDKLLGNRQVQKEAENQSSIFAPQEAICEFCGKKTTDWWMFNGQTGTCKCRECRSRGLY